MLPARFEQASFSLAEINNAKFTRPAVSSGMSVGSFPEQRLVIEPTSSPQTQKLRAWEAITYFNSIDRSKIDTM